MSSVCECPGCGAELEYTIDMCGATVECAACNTQFVLPGADDVQMAPDETQCQACGNIIKRKAKICRFCKTRQTIYCQCSCPECGETFKINHEEQGKQVQCPICGLSVTPFMLEEVVHCMQCECDFTVEASQLGKTLPCPYCKTMIPTTRKRLNLQIVSNTPNPGNSQGIESELPILQAAPPLKKPSPWPIVILILISVIIVPIITLVAPAVSLSRSKAKAESCRLKLKNLGMSFFMYADSHRSRLPENLQELITSGYLGTTDAERAKLSITCPENKREYIYLGNSFVIGRDNPATPIAIEPPGTHPGNTINVLRLEGTVETVTLPADAKSLADVIVFLAKSKNLSQSTVEKLLKNASQYEKISNIQQLARESTTAPEQRTAAPISYSSSECYDKGLRCAENSDYINAVYWYRKAAEQGHAGAQCNLGWCYANGQGVNKSMYETVKWFRKAAEQGHADAQYNLGLCYAKGQGVNKSKYETVKWFRKAAEQGHADAQYNLGWCYANGQGVNKSMYEAVKWFRKAAEQGNAEAQCNLGECYYFGKGVSEDNNRAFYWFTKAAAQNIAWAQYFLGQCYKNGYGTTANIYTAFRYFKLSADRGITAAQCELGKCYAHGWGVDQNMKTARFYLEKAANNNDSEAQYYMGLYWAAQANNSNAAYWYRKAAQQGHKQARAELDKLNY